MQLGVACAIHDVPPPRPLPLLCPTSRRMLVVDDDLDLRNLLQRVAHSVAPGLVVDWTTDAQSARDMMKTHEYALILLDYLLEGRGTGLSLLADCRRRQPTARLALMSAFAVHDLLPSCTPFLPKPFSTAECREFLRSRLASRAA